jgi:amino acid transporter
MTDQLDTEKLPPAAQRVSSALRTAGWVSFWVQLVLAVVATIILLFAIPFALPRATPTGNSSSAGTGGGVFFAICGLIVLGYSVYRAFRFTRLSRELRSPTNAVRPKKADTIKDVRLTLMSNMAGMLLTLIGAEAISGTLLAKSLAQPQAFFGTAIDLSRFIQPLDIFVVLANTHATVAHFVGIVATLWLLDRIHKQ